MIHDRIEQGEQMGVEIRQRFHYFSEENNPLYADPVPQQEKKAKREIPTEETIFHTIRSVRARAQFLAGAVHNMSSEPEAIKIVRRLGGIGPLVALLRAPSAAVCGSAAVALLRRQWQAARQGDNVNPERRSSGSQFYLVQGRPFSDNEMSGIEGRIANFSTEYGNGLANVENGQFVYSDEAREMYKTVGGTPFLDMQYTVFGYVVEGLDIIDSIAAVPTDRRRGDRPLEDVVMSMKRLN